MRGVERFNEAVIEEILLSGEKEKIDELIRLNTRIMGVGSHWNWEDDKSYKLDSIDELNQAGVEILRERAQNNLFMKDIKAIVGEIRDYQAARYKQQSLPRSITKGIKAAIFKEAVSVFFAELRCWIESELTLCFNDSASINGILSQIKKRVEYLEIIQRDEFIFSRFDKWEEKKRFYGVLEAVNNGLKRIEGKAKSEYNKLNSRERFKSMATSLKNTIDELVKMLFFCFNEEKFVDINVFDRANFDRLEKADPAVKKSFEKRAGILLLEIINSELFKKMDSGADAGLFTQGNFLPDLADGLMLRDGKLYIPKNLAKKILGEALVNSGELIDGIWVPSLNAAEQSKLLHWYQSSDSGISIIFRENHALMRDFLHLHGCVQQLVFIFHVVNQAAELSGSAGDLLLYVIIKDRTLELLTCVEQIVQEVETAVNAIKTECDKKVSDINTGRLNRRLTFQFIGDDSNLVWKKNYSAAGFYFRVIKDGLPSCVDNCKAIRAHINGIDTNAYLHMLNEKVTSFSVSIELFLNVRRGIFNRNANVERGLLAKNLIERRLLLPEVPTVENAERGVNQQGLNEAIRQKTEKLQNLFLKCFNLVEITEDAVKFFNSEVLENLVGQPALQIWNQYSEQIARQGNRYLFEFEEVSGFASQLNRLVRSENGDWLPHYFRARILFENKLNFPRRFVLASYQEFSAFLDALSKQLFLQLCSKPLVRAEFESLTTFIVSFIQSDRRPVIESNQAAIRDLPYCFELLSPTARMQVLIRLHKNLGVEAKLKLLLLGYIEMLYFFKLDLLEDANEHFRILSQRQEFGEILGDGAEMGLNAVITEYVNGCRIQEEDDSLFDDNALMVMERNRQETRALISLPREPLDSIEEEQFFEFGMSWCQVWPHPVEVDPTVNEKGDEFILYRKTVGEVNEVRLLMRYDKGEVDYINLTNLLTSQGRIELLDEINWPIDGKKRLFSQVSEELGDELCRLVYQHCSAYHVKQGGLKGYRFFFLSGKPDSVGLSFDELSCVLYKDDDGVWKIFTYHFEGSIEVLSLKPDVLDDNNVKDFLSQIDSVACPSNVKLRVAFPECLMKFLWKSLRHRPPERFICPISLRMMSDPVTADDVDCEKEAFERLKENALKNRRCRLIIPNTDEEVSVNGSVNNDLRKAIAKYRETKRQEAQSTLAAVAGVFSRSAQRVSAQSKGNSSIKISCGK